MEAVMALLARLGFNMDFRTNEEIIEELAEEIACLRSLLQQKTLALKGAEADLQNLYQLVGDNEEIIPNAVKFWNIGMNLRHEMTEDQISIIRDLFKQVSMKMEASEIESLVSKMKSHKDGTAKQSFKWADAAIRKLQHISYC